MGNVSYKLMQIIITRKLREELQAVVDKYKKMSTELDKNDPEYTEKLLQYSNLMFDEMNKIQYSFQKKYKKELDAINGIP